MNCIVLTMSAKGRIGVTLEPEIYQWIAERAAKEGRSLANLAAFFLNRAVRDEMEVESESLPASIDMGAA